MEWVERWTRPYAVSMEGACLVPDDILESMNEIRCSEDRYELHYGRTTSLGCLTQHTPWVSKHQRTEDVDKNRAQQARFREPDRASKTRTRSI